MYGLPNSLKEQTHKLTFIPIPDVGLHKILVNSSWRVGKFESHASIPKRFFFGKKGDVLL